MLIPKSKEGRRYETAKKVRAWTIRNRSPRHCIECATYVGANHALRDRTEHCKLGSEL